MENSTQHKLMTPLHTETPNLEDRYPIAEDVTNCREHDAEGNVPVRGQVDTDRGRDIERIDVLEQDDRNEQA